MGAAPPSVWSRWWVLMWAALFATVVPLAFVLELRWWIVVATVGFLLPEGFALLKKDDRFPPLTQVIQRYISRWVAVPVMGGLVAAATVGWFGASLRWVLGVGAAVTLHDWIHDHFDVTYDERKKVWPMLDKLSRIQKAIVSAVIAGVATAGTGLLDGNLTGGELLAVLGAIIVTGFGTWRVPNKKTKTTK